MLKLQELRLVQYRSIQDSTFTCDADICCFVGPNGHGKTNVLDAIYHLAFTKSALQSNAAQNVHHGTEFFMIEGLFERHGQPEKLLCSFQKGHKKMLKRNGKPFDKITSHVGFIPLVMIAPMDQGLIEDGSETRRRFVDGFLSQMDASYLQAWLHYHKLLQQRNTLLKQMSKSGSTDTFGLQIYTEQMHPWAMQLHEKRQQFMLDFEPLFQHFHQKISAGHEPVSLEWVCDLLEQPWDQMQEKALPKDLILQYTHKGPHKDDFLIQMGAHPIKRQGSQGQQKSVIIALKLAQYTLMHRVLGIQPLLLLDDIFDKLDAQRIDTLIGLVSEQSFGQIFITDTDVARTTQLVKRWGRSHHIFTL